MSAKMPEGQSPLMTTNEAAIWWRVTPMSISRWSIAFNWRRVLDPMGHIRYLREDVVREGKAQVGNKGRFKPQVVKSA